MAFNCLNCFQTRFFTNRINFPKGNLIDMRRKNFYNTAAHKQPEDLVLDLGGCPLSGMEGSSHSKLMALLGYSGYESMMGYGVDERILQYLDIDTRGVGWIFRPEKSVYNQISDTEYIDEWGIRRVFTGLYWDIIENPLRGASIKDLESYPFPDPYSVSRADIDRVIADAKKLYEETDYVICASHPCYGVFELACWLCGFDDFMIKMAIEPEFAEALFAKIFEYQRIVSEMYYSSVGSYIHYTSSGDDFATQQSTFVSPGMFREMIMPCFKERIGLTKKYTRAKFLHHSCGNVSSIIPDLIESGVEILNPIQPTNEKMDPRVLKERFGERIVFHGGLDTQALLPKGDRESIYEGVDQLLKAVSPGGGYIFAAAHNIQEDVPPENIVHMFQAARKLYQRANGVYHQ